MEAALNFLCATEEALQGRRWNSFSPEKKAELKAVVEEELELDWGGVGTRSLHLRLYDILYKYIPRQTDAHLPGQQSPIAAISSSSGSDGSSCSCADHRKTWKRRSRL